MLEIMYHTVLFAMRYCLLDKRERERERGAITAFCNVLSTFSCVCA